MASMTLRGVAHHRLVWLAISALTIGLFASTAFANDGGRHRTKSRSISGAVASIGDDSFVVTKRSGRNVTVKVSDNTSFTKTVGATVADAAVGTSIIAKGSRDADDTLTARRISIVPNQGSDPWGHSVDFKVSGKVSANDGSNLTIVNKDGTETIETNADTTVTKTFKTNFAELAVGDRVQVKGRWSAEGTFAARRVHIRRPAPPAEPVPVAETQQLAAKAVREDTKLRSSDVDGAVHVFGMVGSIASPNFTLRSREGEKLIRTSASTDFLQTVDGALGDASAGSRVTVSGMRRDDGTLVARYIRVHSAGGENTRDGWCDEGRLGISGTVTSLDPSTGVLHVSTGKGDLTVQATSETVVTKTIGANLGHVVAGVEAKIAGFRNEDGSIDATKVHLDKTSGHAAGFRTRDSRFTRDGYRDGDGSWGDTNYRQREDNRGDRSGSWDGRRR